MPEYVLVPARAQAFYAQLAEQALVQKASVNELAVLGRQTLEQVLEEATERFAYRVDFDSAYSRLVFAQQELALPEETASRAHAARRHLNRIIHGKLEESAYLRSLPIGAVALLIEAFSGEPIPEVLAPHIPAGRGYAAEAAAQRRKETTGWIRFVVTGLPEHPDEDAEMLILEGYAESGYDAEDRPIQVLLNRIRDTKAPDRVLRDFTYLADLAWPYARLNLYKLREREDEPGILHTQLESEVVLDPDFLVDASDLASCFSGKQAQPLAFVIKKLVPQPPKGSLFKGSIVNDLLDGILQQPELAYKDAFGGIVKDNFIKTASLGRKELAEIYGSVEEEHLENLQTFARNYHGKPLATEPSYISPRYGLSGRMDVVVHDPDAEPTRWEVVELKSGKPPKHGVWDEHAAQATVYNMLLDSVAYELGYPGRTGATEVFYSKADTKGRLVPVNPAMREAILRTRNYIVAILRQLRRGNMRALEVIGESQEMLAELLRFDREAILAICHAYLKAAPEPKAYYETWLAFLMREFAAAKTGEALANATLRDSSVGGYAGLWRDSLIRKRARFEALEPLLFLEMDGRQQVRFAYDPPEEAHCSLRPGDIVVLYPHSLTEGADGESTMLQPGAYQLAKGTLTEIRPGSITVELRSRVMTEAYFRRHAVWIAEPDQLDSSHWHSVSALFYFLQADDHRPGLQDLILGKAGPALPDPRPVIFRPESRLLASQRDVVEAAVRAQDYYLLQGPPGTGKTSTALPEIILQELARGRKNVTILCYTNRALDEVQQQLERIQREEGIRYLSLKRKARSEEELDSLLKGEDFRLERVAQAIGEVRIFLCTISSFLSNVHYLRQLCGSLDLLIVDEASMATEAQLVGLLPFFTKFILVGDENQLPPVVVQSPTHTQVPMDSPLWGLGFRDLRHSLFERLLVRCRQNGWSHAYGMLTDHFRMHPLIADLINPYYGNRLHAAASYADEGYTTGEGHPLGEILTRGRTLFVETGPGSVPKHHVREARLVAEFAQAVHTLDPTLHIGILSPWRAQNRQIVLELEALGLRCGDGPDAIKVDTIERYQGGERDVILLSTALSEARYLAAMQSVIGREDLPGGYTAVDRKLVVALSRARRQILIFGHAPFLAPDPHFGPVLEVIKRRGGFIPQGDLKN